MFQSSYRHIYNLFIYSSWIYLSLFYLFDRLGLFPICNARFTSLFRYGFKSINHCHIVWPVCKIQFGIVKHIFLNCRILVSLKGHTTINRVNPWLDSHHLADQCGFECVCVCVCVGVWWPVSMSRIVDPHIRIHSYI